MEGESLHVNREAGVEMIIAIDSTRLGPALGGCRWKPYPNAAAARHDALELARAMTRKAALARLSLGGGKAVVIGDPRTRTREQLLAFGEFVDSLAGSYITAADMGTGAEEMAVIAERTSFVIGLPENGGGCGDPGPYTALGVKLAIDAALSQLGRSLDAAHVAVQGVGNVGVPLVELLLEAGARVSAADTSASSLDTLPPQVTRISTEEILALDCDVFAPCGPSGVIDDAVAKRLSCRVVCGAANNPLRESSAARVLHDRDVLYVPDFLSNAGGLIHLACAIEGGDDAASRSRLSVIPENLDAVLARATRDDVDLAEAAEGIALEAVAAGEDAKNTG